MSVARGHVVAAAVNDKLYVFGGWVGGSATNAVEEYDPATGMWATKTPMPTARYASGVAVVNDLIYVIGGMDMSSNVFNTVEEYDPATDSWTTKTPMPTARFGPGCAVVNDTIYAFGGSTSIGGNATTITQCYDPVTDSWAWCSSMSHNRYCVGGFSYNDLAYAVGGYDYYNYHTTIEVYDPAAGSWSGDTPMNYGRQSVAVGMVGDCVYVIGGWNNGALPYNEEGFLGVGIAEYNAPAVTDVSATPNPFRSEMCIVYSVARAAKHINVVIYDVKGSIVKHLARSTPDALRCSLIWDGTDNRGEQLPSGTYLVVIDAGEARHTEKVTLIR
jgi:N-acetylneuraminic acid mutarotase